MTQRLWQHGDWAKVGDLVRYMPSTGTALSKPREMAIVSKVQNKPHVGQTVYTTQWGWIRSCHVQVYKPNFDYDREVNNG
tara:strand:- start:551 stop:790 length:240 start_codon:yes stop_codon:yes gene_type:complete